MFPGGGGGGGLPFPPFVIQIFINRAIAFLEGVLMSFLMTVWFSGEVYAFGAAWFAGLTMLLLGLIDTSVELKDGTVYKKRELTQCLNIFAIIAIASNAIAALLLFIRPPLNGEDQQLKPLFATICLIVLAGWYYAQRQLTIEEVQEDNEALEHYMPRDALKAKGEENDETEEDEGNCTDNCECCCACDANCCTGFLLFLIFWASLFVMVLFRRQGVYYDNYDGIFLNNNLENPDQKAAFRCTGSGRQLVLLMHGYQGQSIDLSHIWLAFEDSTDVTVCTFDRQGYGQSRVFGANPRTGETFAKELDVALDNLALERDVDINNLVLVAHSMGGFNSRAFDVYSPGRVKGMVLIDPLAPELSDMCEPGQSQSVLPFQVVIRLVDSGLLLPVEAVGIIDLIGSVNTLPSQYQDEYTTNIVRTDFFKTIAEEGLNLGTTCYYVRDHKIDFPLTVVVPDGGIYSRNLDEAMDEFGQLGKTLLVEGAGHINVLFDNTYAQLITRELELILDQLN